jgi:hypothetical protein
MEAFFRNIGWLFRIEGIQKNLGHIAFALTALLLFANILTMVSKKDTDKSYYGMDISALFFLIVGFILDYFYNQCAGTVAPRPHLG